MLAAGLLVSVRAFAQAVENPDISLYGTGKIRGYQQTTATVATPYSYSFIAFVEGREGGTINAARISGPLGFLNANGPQNLTRIGSYLWEYRSTAFVNSGDLDQAFPDVGGSDPNGYYRLQIDTGLLGGANQGFDYSIALKLNANNPNSYPDAVPVITASAGQWLGGQLVFDAAQSINFGFNFSGYRPSTDFVIFTVLDSSGNVVTRSIHYQSPGVPTGYGFDANAFAVGSYTGSLMFGRVLSASSDIPGATGIGYYALETNFNFTAVPEPSTYALMVLGLGMILLVRRRRTA